MIALVASMAPTYASAPVESYQDAQSVQVMQMLNGQSCAARLQQAQSVPPAPPEQIAQVQTTPSPSPTPSSLPTFGPIVPPAGQLYATPFPRAGSPTPYAIPTTTPSNATPGPVFLTRPSSPPSIAPARPYASSSPSAEPSAVPTLRPGYIAVLADKITGSTKPGIPGDATGNVYIYYSDEVLIGQRAHYDGIKTITVTGNPYIVNNTKNSILYADRIVFDTVAQKAFLYKGRGESSQGVENGLAYYTAVDMRTDEHGVAHGDYASLTTCENPRGGYHLTSKTIDVIPSDKIVLTKVVLWLGAAAVFFLPRVVIPLRTVSDQRQRPQFFPDIGYNQLQGYYLRTRLGFGKDQYYYGTYDIEFYSKQGTTLGYSAQIAKKNGRRVTQINVQRVENKIPPSNSTTYNAQIQDTENFSQTLRGQFGYTYTGAYGPYTNFPAQEQYQAQVAHTSVRDSQSYSFNRNSLAGQSNSDSYGFTDTRSFGLELQNQFSLALSHTNGYGTFSSNATATVNDLFHWTSKGVDYEMNYNKTLAATPFGLNKEPELTIRPMEFLPHFIWPVEPTFIVGEYNEPATPETTQRADLGFNIGPALYRIYGSDFSATVDVNQYLYGTGDEKASIQQILTLNSPVGSGRHAVNLVSYNEENFNGPGAVPFQTLDLQNGENTKEATDTLRIFNGDVYALQLGYSTLFNGVAQPWSYQLTSRPSRRSYLTLAGTWNPGPGNGFPLTTFQLSTPFGKDSWLQFLGDLNWKEKGRVENKTIFYSHIIGNCYEFQVSYNQSSSQVNVSLFVLAFPSHAANVGIITNGAVLPTSLNGSY